MLNSVKYLLDKNPVRGTALTASLLCVLASSVSALEPGDTAPAFELPGVRDQDSAVAARENSLCRLLGILVPALPALTAPDQYPVRTVS